MSQAETLLSTLSETTNIHEHDIKDTDTYFVIDPVTRAIEHPSYESIVLIQRDHNSSIFTFELPRYVDGHDMTLCTAVKAHYNNISEDGLSENADVADLHDLRVNPKNTSTVTCSWTIHRQATQLAGTLNFLVQYLCTDSEGNETYEWHTDIYSAIEVRQGRNNGPAAIIEYTDILEQWRAKIFGAKDSLLIDLVDASEEQQAAIVAKGESQVAAIELKGAETLESIPADYTATYNMADEAYRKRADAIVSAALGETITVNDSSNNYIQELKIYGRTEQITTTGKNLLPVPDSINTIKGVTFTVNSDKSISVSGTPTDVCAASLYGTYGEPIAFPAGSYTISGGIDENRYLRVRIHTSDGTLKSMKYDVGEGKNFTVEDGELVSISMYFATLEPVDGLVFRPMIRLDTIEDVTYEPYTGGKASPNPDYPQELTSIENPTAYIYGENILNLDEGLNDQFIKNDDGTYTIQRLGSYRFSEFMEMHVPANVPITGRLYGARDDDFSFLYIQFMSEDSKHTKAMSLSLTTDTRTVTCDYPIAKARIYMPPAAVDGDSKTFSYIKVQLGTEATEYEAYKPVQSLAFTHTLRAIPVESGGNYTDSNGQQWIADYVDCENKQLVQRVHKFALHDAAKWLQTDVDTIFQICCYLPYESEWIAGFCTHYEVRTNYSTTDKPYIRMTAGKITMYYEDVIENYTTIDEWTTFLTEQNDNGTPVELVYVLAKPIITSLTDEEITAYKALRTNYVNTTITNDCGAYMELAYAADTKTYINNNYVPKSVIDDVLKRLAVLEAA